MIVQIRLVTIHVEAAEATPFSLTGISQPATSFMPAADFSGTIKTAHKAYQVNEVRLVHMASQKARSS